MPELTFQVQGAEPVLFAAAPQLVFKLHLGCAPAERPVHSVLLRCQIRIEPARRHYGPGEAGALHDLFGEPARWSQTQRSMLWTHSNVMMPGFTGSTVVDLPVPCTFDFNVAATKFFHALEGGEAPLCLLFSGTVFHEDEEGQLQVAQIPWEKEVRYRMPVRVWKEMMDHYYPNQACLHLRRDVFDRLYAYKVAQGLPTWEQTVDRLLDQRREAAP